MAETSCSRLLRIESATHMLIKINLLVTPLRLTTDVDGLLIDGHVAFRHCGKGHVDTAVTCGVLRKNPSGGGQ